MTSALRTAYDMVRFAPSLVVAIGLLDCFVCELNPQPVDVGALQELIASRPHARGNARVRTALRYSSTRSRSIPESQLRARLRFDCGLQDARLLVNATLDHRGRCYELDLVDASSGLVLEYDSRFHTDAQQRGLDAAKDAAVDEAGLVMRRVNSPLLGAPRQLAHAVGSRRATALARGGNQRVAELGLRELPLRRYN